MYKQMLRALGGLLLLASLPVYTSEPSVLASIKPLALIAREITGDVDTLLPAGGSPHEFSLRVSDMRQINSVPLVIWIGAGLEGFLQKPLAGKSPQQVLTLSQLPGLHWPSALAHHHHGHSHGQQHEQDWHLWLNPLNAVVIANAIAERLGEIQGSLAPVYRRRAEDFAARMQLLDTDLQTQLAPLNKEGFAVYHDAYNHFVARYGLKQMDYISLTPEQQPGARHVHHLSQSLTGARCLFTEPGADSAMVDNLARRGGLVLAELDPLATRPGTQSYSQLLQALALDLSACLGQ
ncbi:MAG TPA: zinc ABC transporter substrate-binding protein [Cellvibrionaceae bacterium]